MPSDRRSKKERKSRYLLAAMIVFQVVLFPHAQSHGQSSHAASASRPKIGLVLAGGGAKGAAHVGVIQVLERLGVPIDFIAGTSMGAIVGGLYASGLTSDELADAIRSIDWEDIFQDKPPRANRDFRRKLDDQGFLMRFKFGHNDDGFQFPRGIVNGQKLKLALRALTVKAFRIYDFDRLPIPFRAVASDIETGERIVLGAGNLATAMRASMAVPGFFPPVELNGRLLVDGALVDNLPIDVAREMGADILIVVNFKDKLKSRKKLNSAISIVSQSLDLLVMQNSRIQLKSLRPDDVYIELDLGEIGATSFKKAAEAIPIGEKGASSMVSRLRQLASLRRKPERIAKSPTSPAPPSPESIIVDFIRIDNKSRLSDKLISSRLTTRVGERLDFDKLESDMERIYGLDYFETIDYQVVMEGDKTGLVVTATEKSEGLNSFRFGLNLESNFDGESAYNLSTRYQKEGVNGLGGELDVQAIVGDQLGLVAAFIQPLDPATRYFIGMGGGFLARNVPIFRQGAKAGEFRVSKLSGRIDAGRQLGNWGALSLGVEYGHGWRDVDSGSLLLENDEFGIGAFFAKFGYDTLDNLNFPISGAKARAEFRRSTAALGGENTFNSVTGNGLISHSWGRNTVLLSGETGLTFNGDAPSQDLFDLGGFLRLSGYQSLELTGQNFATGRLLLYHNFGAKQEALFGMPVYLGASLEAGNVWETRGAMGFDDVIVAGSLFVGLDTPLGPVYLAYGHAEGGNNSVYLFLGQTF